MANVHVTEDEIKRAVSDILKDGDVPIYYMQDDHGLEKDEYFNFALAICQKLGLVSSSSTTII